MNRRQELENKDGLTDEEAGELFDCITAEFEAVWRERYPDEPFMINGCVTPRALAFISGYVAGRNAQ